MIALMLGAGLFHMGNDQKGDDTVFVLTIIGIKDVCFRKLIEISVWTRLL